MKRTLILAVAATLVVTACGDDDDSETTTPAVPTEDADSETTSPAPATDGTDPGSDTTAAPGGTEPEEEAATFDCAGIEMDEVGGQLTVYSGRDEELVGPLLDCFGEVSGIETSVRYASSEEMALQIQAEGDATEADVFFSQTPGALGFLEGEGLLADLPAELLDEVDEEYQSDVGQWVGVSGRVRTLAYNTDNVTEDELPATVDEVLGEEWAGRIGVPPSNASFQDFVAAMVLERGEDETATFLDGLVSIDPQIYEGNSAVVDAIIRGEIDAGLVNHYYAEQFLAEDPEAPVANHFFEQGDLGSYVLVAGAGQLESSENTEQATAFIGFLLGEGAQEYFRDITKEYPIAAGVEPVEGLPGIDTVGLPDADEGALGEANATAIELIEAAGLPLE
ncbi:MAG: extracellular solute-binding protein [Actinomycetota bacterium]|nr:extracellular solute-binding protein [Actinomycetota bacterium]